MFDTINVGNTDRLIRFVVGGILILLGLFAGGMGILHVLAFIIGAVLIFTGYKRSCPIYKAVSMNTADDDPTNNTPKV